MVIILPTSSVPWKCVVLPGDCQVLCQDSCKCGCFTDKALWFSTQRCALVKDTSFLQGLDYGPRRRQMRMQAQSAPSVTQTGLQGFMVVLSLCTGSVFSAVQPWDGKAVAAVRVGHRI